MNISIITIGTGKYKPLLDGLISSIEKLMFVGINKDVFVFSDGYIKNCKLIKINNLPWPLITLMKFYYINTLDLSMYDLVYFIDGDCLIYDIIGEDIIPNRGQLVAVEHPWQKINSNCYDVNKNSTACVVNSNGMHYFQGCFFGGYRDDFCKMSIELEKNINEDLKNNIIAKWHDESHLNKYFINHPPKQLSCEYAYPDMNVWTEKFGNNPKIIHRNYKAASGL